MSSARHTARPSSQSRRSTRILAALLLAAVAAPLTGCAVVSKFTSHEREQVFATRADAANSGDEAFAPPHFMPDDATNLRFRVVTNGPGYLVRYTSPEEVVAGDCTPGTLEGAPAIDTSWWPETVPTEGVVCPSGWQVFELDGETYAWVS